MTADDVVILLTLGAVATACGLLGPFLVVRRTSLVADAVGHAVLPGIVAAYLVGGWRHLGVRLVAATAVAVLCVLGIDALRRRRTVDADAAIGLVFPALFAIGVIGVTSTASGVHLDLDATVFGEITFAPLRTVPVTGVEVPWSLIATGAAVVMAAVSAVALWRPLVADTFDPVAADVVGLRGVAAGRLLLVSVAIVAVLVFETIGAVLLVAYLIVPAASGHLLARRMVGAVGLAIAFGWVAAGAGYGLAGWADTSIAGAVGLANVVGFALARLVFARSSYRRRDDGDRAASPRWELARPRQPSGKG